MPSRSVAVAIILFWLAANGWLLYREVWPQWRAGEPPAYTIDLTEELGKSAVAWDVYQKGAKIGSAFSEVARQPDRTYKLGTQYHFDKLKVLGVEFRKLVGVYHVTEDGDLLGLSAQIILQQSAGKLGLVYHQLDVRGTVQQGALVPQFFYNLEEVKLGEVRIPVEGRGGILNPLQLVNRLPGLHVGRRWRIALFDPLGADLGKALGPQFEHVFTAVESVSVRELDAEVVTDTLEWEQEEVPCFKIEYRKPGEPDLIAATWVRRRDGLVLQQHSSHGLTEMTLRRVPPSR
jgi:hypothetical protein